MARWAPLRQLRPPRRAKAISPPRPLVARDPDATLQPTFARYRTHPATWWRVPSGLPSYDMADMRRHVVPGGSLTGEVGGDYDREVANRAMVRLRRAPRLSRSKPEFG